MSTQLTALDRRIEKVKQELMSLGSMRPGSITRQYRQPKDKKRPFYQISYTRHMQSHSEYVRPEHLAAVRRETTNYKRFRRLVDQWVALALVASKMRASAKATRHQKRA